MALLKSEEEVIIGIPIAASGKYCGFCRFQFFMGIGLCQLFNKSLKTKKGKDFQYTFRCTECFKAQQTK